MVIWLLIDNWSFGDELRLLIYGTNEMSFLHSGAIERPYTVNLFRTNRGTSHLSALNDPGNARGRIRSKKIPLTPFGNELAAFRFIAKRLNHCVTAVLLEGWWAKEWSGCWSKIKSMVDILTVINGIFWTPPKNREPRILQSVNTFSHYDIAPIPRRPELSRNLSRCRGFL